MATNLENKINRVATNVTDALAAIAAKGVDISGMNSDNLAALIAALATLPALTTPGVAADLRTGKQLIDGSGNIVTGTMPEQAAQTITPGTSNKTIASGRYLTGTQTIKGDSNLNAANIVSGKTIFGVTGTYTGGGKMVNGSFTLGLGVQNQTHTVTHSLGAIPNLVIAMPIRISPQNNDIVFYVNYKGTRYLNTISKSKPFTNVSANSITSTSDGFGSATTSTIIYTDVGYSTYETVVHYIIGVV